MQVSVKLTLILDDNSPIDDNGDILSILGCLIAKGADVNQPNYAEEVQIQIFMSIAQHYKQCFSSPVDTTSLCRQAQQCLHVGGVAQNTRDKN